MFKIGCESSILAHPCDNILQYRRNFYLNSTYSSINFCKKDSFYGKGQILKWVNVLFFEAVSYTLNYSYTYVEVSLTATLRMWIYTYIAAHQFYVPTHVFVSYNIALWNMLIWDIIKIDWSIKMYVVEVLRIYRYLIHINAKKEAEKIAIDAIVRAWFVFYFQI